METTIIDNAGAGRYELRIDGRLAGLADYRVDGDTVSFPHTETVPAFSGQGVARTIVEHALGRAREAGQSVLPHCWYVAKVIGEAPDRWLDLVPVARRAEFGLPS